MKERRQESNSGLDEPITRRRFLEYMFLGVTTAAATAGALALYQMYQAYRIFQSRYPGQLDMSIAPVYTTREPQATSESSRELEENTLELSMEGDGLLRGNTTLARVLTTNADLNLRDEAGLGANIVGKLTPNSIVEINTNKSPRELDGYIWFPVVTDQLDIGLVVDKYLEIKESDSWFIPQGWRRIISRQPTRTISNMRRTEGDRSLFKSRILEKDLLTEMDRAILNEVNFENYKTPQDLKEKLTSILIRSGISPKSLDSFWAHYDWFVIGDNEYRGGGRHHGPSQMIYTQGLLRSTVVHEYGHFTMSGITLWELAVYGVPYTTLSVAWWVKSLSEADEEKWFEYKDVIMFVRSFLDSETYLEDGRSYADVINSLVENVGFYYPSRQYSQEEMTNIYIMSEPYARLLEFHMGYPFGPRRLPRECWNGLFASICTGNVDYSDKPYYID